MNYGDFLRGMGAGLLIGIAVGMAVKSKKKPAKQKGSFCRILKAMGDAVESISDTMGF